jgi:phosphohistidine phosphatase
MQLFLMRHGIAEQRTGPFGSSDAKRPLTPKGRKRTKQIASGLRRLGVGFEWIVTSPLVRARETAEILAEAAPGNVRFDPCTALRPGGSFEELMSFLAESRNHRRVLLVGHEPDLSALAARLIGAGPAANFAFKKGGCCLIHCDRQPGPSAGELVWWMPPSVLRSLR